MSIEKILYDHRITRDQYSPLCACGGWRDKRDDGHGHAAHVAELIRAELASDEAVETVARTIAEMEPGEEWPTTCVLDDEYVESMRDEAKDALKGLIGYLGGE